MNTSITYEFIWQVAQKERLSNELQLIPKTFYDDADSFILAFEGRELSEEEQTTKKNAQKLIYEIYERRKQKIVIYVAYKKQMPQPAVQREQEFYNKMTEITANNTLEQPKTNKPVLRSLQAIPEIILPSGKKMGPLQKDQILEVADRDDANFLVSNTICQVVN